MTKFFTLSWGEGGSQTYKYFILLFFTVSLGGEGGKVNDAIFTKSAVFLLDVFPKEALLLSQEYILEKVSQKNLVFPNFL